MNGLALTNSHGSASHLMGSAMLDFLSNLVSRS